MRARIQRRGEETGRFIPEAEIISSLSDPEISISRLAPLCDLVVRIENNTTIKLLSVEDHSGNWHRGLYRHFGVISRQHLPFPAGLGPLYLENTAIHGHPFRMITKTISYSAFYPEFEGTLFVKATNSLRCISRIYLDHSLTRSCLNMSRKAAVLCGRTVL